MIDADPQIEAVSRGVSDREIEGRLARVVTLAQTYDTDIDDLWDAVTNAERIARWLTPVRGDLRLGGRYQLEGNAGGTITACEPPHAFDATWEFGGATSWIEVRLTVVDAEHSRLELAHLAHPEEHWEQFGPGAVGIGWDLGLLGLVLYLEQGERPPDADAFPTTPEGVRFIVASGQAWGRADAEGGEDASVARAAADRTVAAYTEPPPEAG
jgi:uncharacterized protein YndB with AHSA1/START domain